MDHARSGGSSRIACSPTVLLTSALRLCLIIAAPASALTVSVSLPTWSVISIVACWLTVSTMPDC